MKDKINSVNRRTLLRTVGTGVVVGSVSSLSGCLGQTDETGAASEVTRDQTTGTVEATDEGEITEEPSPDPSLAGSATGEPSGIESHNISFEGRYNPRNYRPVVDYESDWVHFFNMGGYVARVEVFEKGVDDGEPEINRDLGISGHTAFVGYGDIRVSVVGSSESLVIDADVTNIEIWLAGPVGRAHYWLGEY